MYDYFKGAGYHPRWVKGKREPGREGVDPQELMMLTEKEDYLKPHEIVYFEDPFGKTQYERSSDLENYIGSIIDNIREIEDSYVIITSREEVFKEFQKQHLSSIELKNFENKMNLKKACYDSERRKEILLRWAKVSNCKWLFNSALTRQVLAAFKNQQFLSTPLNIREFVKGSRNTLDNKYLEDLMKQKSEETIRRFGDEIMRMEEDERILFLSFPYVSDRLCMKLVEKVYAQQKQETANIIAQTETECHNGLEVETIPCTLLIDESPTTVVLQGPYVISRLSDDRSQVVAAPNAWVWRVVHSLMTKGLTIDSIVLAVQGTAPNPHVYHVVMSKQ